MRRLLFALPLLLSACTAGAPAPPAAIGPSPGFETIAEKLTAFIEHEMDAKGLPAVSIALVDNQETVWAMGFGEEREGVAADAATIYRVGSVSKLFTDLAIMQLVERGELDLDAPITDYLPRLEIGAPTSPSTDAPTSLSTDAPTLRQLMSHRAP